MYENCNAHELEKEKHGYNTQITKRIVGLRRRENKFELRVKKETRKISSRKNNVCLK